MEVEGPVSQGKLESSVASTKDRFRHRETLTGSRLTEMTSLMRGIDGQADDCLKSVSDQMHR